MQESSFAGLTFGARIQDYEKFRFSYPPSLFERIDGALDPELRGTAVDLGSGTGLSATPLAGRFARVVAVEPDARMAAQIPRRDDLEVVVAKAEDAPFSDRSVDLVTCGTAFYWMDGPRVLDRAAGWLVARGLLAVFRFALPEVPAPLAPILDRELREHWNAFRHERLLDEEYSFRVISEHGAFTGQKRINLPHPYRMDAAALAGFFGSTSYAGAYMRTLPDADRYLERLHRELEGAIGKDQVEINFPTELILATPRAAR